MVILLDLDMHNQKRLVVLQIGGQTIAGPARAQHTWTDLEGRKYAAIGTSKVLLIYYEDAFYDITPLDAALTGATFTSTNGSTTVTVNKTAHGLVAGDYFTFTSVTLPGGGATSFTVANFTDQTFEVIHCSGRYIYNYHGIKRNRNWYDSCRFSINKCLC